MGNLVFRGWILEFHSLRASLQNACFLQSMKVFSLKMFPLYNSDRAGSGWCSRFMLNLVAHRRMCDLSMWTFMCRFPMRHQLRCWAIASTTRATSEPLHQRSFSLLASPIWYSTLGGGRWPSLQRKRDSFRMWVAYTTIKWPLISVTVPTPKGLN